MKLKNPAVLMLIAFLAVFFISCETQTAFRSEKKLNKQIQAHTWASVKLNQNANDEDWVFSNGTVYRTIYELDGGIKSDTGTYSIDAKLSYSYLTMRDFRRTHDRLDARWTIVELTDDVMALAYKSDITGLVQREFVKK
ncbi:MAG: hypothetical protein ACR2GN_08775 [Bacteroidia bacterium]